MKNASGPADVVLLYVDVHLFDVSKWK
jgi:hypothetical protein